MARAGYIIFMSLFLWLGSRAVSAQEVLDKIVAVVDDKIILLSELNQFAYQMAIQMEIDPRTNPDKFEELRHNALQNLVDQKVLLTKAQEDSIMVDDRQVEQILEERLTAMVQQLGSEEKAEEYFGMPLRKIRRTLRKDISEALMVRNLQQRKFHEIKVSRREVEEFYHANKDSLPTIKESVNLSHILFNIEPSEEAISAAREKIEGLLTRIRTGESFADLAAQYSEDPGSAKRGGELGFIERGDFVREFEEVAFNLQPGEISDVVQTQYGFHIIQLIDRRGEKVNARHILVRVPVETADEGRTLQKLQELREKIKAGDITFEEAAKEHSDDATTSDNGGNLGWFELGQLQVAQFRSVAEELEPGEISEPIKTQFGYHIVRLNDRREPRQFSLTEDWQQIEDMALSSKSEQEFRTWLESVKKEMYIDLAGVN